MMIEVDLLTDGRSRRRKSPGGAGASLPRAPLRLFLQDPWVMASGAVGLVALALAVWLASSGRARLTMAEDGLEAAAKDSARIAALVAETDSLRSLVDAVDARAAAVEDLNRRRLAWPRLLDEVARALPEDAWLVQVAQISLADAAGPIRFRVEGKSLGSGGLSRFWSTLESSPHLADVRLVGTEQVAEAAPMTGEVRGVQFFVMEASQRSGPRP